MSTEKEQPKEPVMYLSSKTGLPIVAKPCENGCGDYTEFGGWCSRCLQRDLEQNSPHLLQGGAGFGAW